MGLTNYSHLIPALIQRCLKKQLYCYCDYCTLESHTFLCIFRYTERSNLEIQLFNIQMKLRASRQKTWYPPEGKLVSDINKVCIKSVHIQSYTLHTCPYEQVCVCALWCIYVLDVMWDHVMSCNVVWCHRHGWDWKLLNTRGRWHLEKSLWGNPYFLTHISLHSVHTYNVMSLMC